MTDPKESTPLPWHMSAVHIGLVLTETGLLVARCPSEVNAAFIVRACNSHEALVKALEKTRRHLVYATNEIVFVRDNGCGSPDPDDKIKHFRKTIVEAADALSLAKGGDE